MRGFIFLILLFPTLALAQRYPPISGGVPTYANQISLPAIAADGAVAVTLDTDTVWVYNFGSLTWLASAGPGVPLSVGAVGSSPNASAAVISSNVLTIEPASASFPGVVTTGVQTFAGAKTFSSTIAGSISGNAATATALAATPTGCSTNQFATTIAATGNLGCSQPNFSQLAGSASLTSQVSGTLPIGNGGTGLTSTSQNFVFAGPTSGSGAPSWRALVSADIPSLAASYVAVGATAGGGLTGSYPNPSLAAPTSSVLGGVKSAGPVANQFLYAIDTTGAPLLRQASFPDVSGTLAITQGGTGQTSANAALNALLPSQSGKANDVLQSDGTNTSWVAGGGTVTSVAFTPDGIHTVSGSPVTGSGTIVETLSTQSANTVFAGPSSGSAATPGFRSLVPADVPTAYSPRNFLINGAFPLWQRGTSVTVANGSNTYEADRWYVTNVMGASAVVTYSQVAAATDGSSFGASIKVTTAPGVGTNSGPLFTQIIDNQTSLQLYNKTASGSVRVKALGNVTAVSIGLYYSTNESKTLTQLSGVGCAINSSTFTLCSIANVSVGTAMTTSGVVALQIQSNAASSGNVSDLNNGFVVEQGEVNLGSVAAPFSPAGAAFAQELAMAQRFYEKTFDLTTAPVQNGGSTGALAGNCFTANAQFTATWQFKASKRATPTVTTYSTNAASANWSTNTTTPTAAVVNIGVSNLQINGTTSCTAGNSYNIHASADADI